jgi:hypothetical protein
LSGTRRHRISRNNNNDDSESNSKNDDAITDKTDKPVAPSKMKMPVDRCVALMLSAMQRNRNLKSSKSCTTTIVTTTITVSRSLIALQPSLQPCIYSGFLACSDVFWESLDPNGCNCGGEGYDLYDPASWRRQTKTSTSNINGNGVNGNTANGDSIIGNSNKVKG